jgi:vacuolar protein sorting-associated protein 35
MPPPGPPPEGDDEGRRLAEAKQIVKQEAFRMKRALDQRNLRDALKHASTMLSELRTSLLGPRNYYDLYITATDELRHMEAFFEAEQKRGRRMLELYELVQHAGNVLPRLYLLLAVGSVYIMSKEAPSKDVLKDLVEMCRGVQHPMRGLFLRNFLSQTSKDKLPDAGSEYEGAGGDVSDSVSFILSNFNEMNKLWVRMQHQGPVREREKREKERSDLRILVGTNLLRLSQLEGVTIEMYSETVLPQVLEQVVNCKDAIAQQYLMECVIQVFPVEYHVATLRSYLEHSGYLSVGADVKALLICMMDRLAAWTPPEEEPEEDNVFSLLSGQVSATIQKEEGGMELAHVLQLHKALLNFALGVYPSKLEYADHVLGTCAEVVGKVVAGGAPLEPRCSSLLLELVSVPLDKYPDILDVLQLPRWPEALGHLSLLKQREVAGTLVAKVLEKGAKIDQVAQADMLLTQVRPLLIEDPDAAKDEEDATVAFDEDDVAELSPVACLMQVFYSEDTDSMCRVLNAAHRHATAAANPRSIFTLVPLAFAFLDLVRKIKLRVDAGEEVEIGCRKLLEFIGNMVETLKQWAPAAALRLHLQCALVADAVGEEGWTYDVVAQTFEVYEEHLADSRAQLAAVTLAAGTLPQMSGLGEDNYETLSTKTTQYSAKLLKKPDQCRAVARASYMFWSKAGDEPYRNPKRVLECLQRSLKIADACKANNAHVSLFVEILDAYLFHFEQENEMVESTHLNSLMQLIEQQLGDAPDTPPMAAARAHYANTRRALAAKKEANERFQEIDC